MAVNCPDPSVATVMAVLAPDEVVEAVEECVEETSDDVELL